MKPKIIQSTPASLKPWFSGLIKKASFGVKACKLLNSAEWLIADGAIRHRSGLFFNIIGVSWEDNFGRTISQPFIEQREVGTLGFLLQTTDSRNKLLVQAKIEPGNIGITQLAPTYQATASNAARVHGGKLPAYSTYFYPKYKKLISESLQSEQGSRFIGKQNRNILSTATGNINIAKTHKWLAVDEVLGYLCNNFLINTDARSVLVCSPWEHLVTRQPFSRYRSEISAELQKSYQANSRAKIKTVLSALTLLQSSVPPVKIIDINKLNGWQVDGYGIKPKNGGGLRVKQITVIAKTREVPTWDQPIIDSTSPGFVDLVCGRQNGVLMFLFQLKREIGLHNYVELSPTYVQEPGVANQLKYDLLRRTKGKILAESWQSDEGGRFFQDISCYRLIDVGEAYKVDGGWYWLSLSEIKTILNRGSYFTNEARSALSLLLAWL